MAVGSPPEDSARRMLRLYQQAENELLNQLGNAIARGVATNDMFEEAAEASRLRTDAQRIVDQLEAAIEEEAEEAHRKARNKGRRDGEQEARSVEDLTEAEHRAGQRIIGRAARRADDIAVHGPISTDGSVRGLAERGRVQLRTDALHDPYQAGINRAPVDQLARSLTSRMTPVHRAITRNVDDIYRRVIAQSASGSAMGTRTRQEAAQEALNRFARRGVGGFVDRAGRRWDLTSYVEMATRTSTARAAMFAGIERMQSAGIDLVYVSAHTGACDLCGPWEGKVLFADGTAGAQTLQVQSAVSDEYVTVDVAGSLDTAMTAGFMHPHCRHSVSAYLPGATTLPTLPGTDRRTEYGHTQRLRYLERRVRAAKRVEAAAMSPAAARDARRAIRAEQARIRDHVKATGVARQRNREQITRAR